MTTTAKPSRNLRLAATALFIGLPLLGVGLTAGNLIRAAELAAAVAQREAELAPLSARLARAGPSADADLSAVWLTGSSRSLAAAQLQQHLVGVIASTSSRVIEVQDVEPSAEAAQDIALRLTFDATNGGILVALSAIEAGLPVLMVDQLAIANIAAGDGSGNDDPLLRVELTVRGFWREGTGP